MKEKIVIPNNWDQVTLGDYCLWQHAVITNNSLDSLLSAIEIFSDWDREQIAKIEMDDLKRISKALSFLNEPPPSNLPDEFVIDEVKYVANLDARKMLAGQYIDLKSNAKTDLAARTNLHLFCAIFYLPEGEEYGDSSMRDRAAIFHDHLDMTLGYPIAVFFCEVHKELMQSLKQKQIEKAERAIKKAKKILTGSLNTGNGSRS